MPVTLTSKTIRSIGIDIGTSTTHLVFSELLLTEDPASRTKKFKISQRKILYRSPIYLTPLLNNSTIDAEKIAIILKKEYESSGIDINSFDTGAVIITGETARKDNADAILNLMAENAGKFVAATAGPNFESLISCYGSGITEYSEKNSKSIIHVDIGGGTSNIALALNGKILSTACINVGGRLIVFDTNSHKIKKFERAAQLVAQDIGVNLEIGQDLTDSQLTLICERLTQCLFEVLLKASPYHPLTEKLFMTSPLFKTNEEYPLYDGYSFSGGVAEYIYGFTDDDYNDIGRYLANSIITEIHKKNYQLIAPNERIRATVIGAGQYSLNLSGSTTFISPTTSFPLKNIPVISPHIDRSKFSIEHVADAIIRAYNRIDILEGSKIVALAFTDPVGLSYNKIKEFALGVEKALPLTLKTKFPLILLFDTDIGKSVGNILKRETQIHNDILSIDEISVLEGAFLDIGTPLIQNEIVPVVVKSLVFN